MWVATGRRSTWSRHTIVGVDELRLAGPGAGHAVSQLADFADAQVFTQPLPAQLEAVEGADEDTRAVVGYLHGNCAHCHNGSPRSVGSLSLEHGVALQGTVGVPTEGSGMAQGLRIDPGSPATSILFLAFSGEAGEVDEAVSTELRSMPPLGVQRRDAAMIERMRAWIGGLPTP